MTKTAKELVEAATNDPQANPWTREFVEELVELAMAHERERWVVALAQGMQRAGCLHSPLEPDPVLIEKLIRERS